MIIGKDREMTLSCYCDDYYDSWYEDTPKDFTKFSASRRKRCVSCNKLINIGADCLQFEMYCRPRSYVEEEIYGDCVPMANQYMCGGCGEIFLNLSSLGYCMDIGHNVKEDLQEYWDMTGFEPK
jgi:hypothetical protein